MPIFRKGRGPHALPLAMSGVKLGERLLYVGSGRPRLFAALAAKPGLTGRACAIVTGPAEVEAMQQAAAREGVLADIATGAAGTFPYDNGSFDVAVADSTDGALGAMSQADGVSRLCEIARVLRPGGRLLVVEHARRGIRALLGGARVSADYQSAGGAKALLETAGFRPVRVLAEREGFRFTEGIKPATSART